jgi:hypothetical protein
MVICKTNYVKESAKVSQIIQGVETTKDVTTLIGKFQTILTEVLSTICRMAFNYRYCLPTCNNRSYNVGTPQLTSNHLRVQRPILKKF